MGDTLEGNSQGAPDTKRHRTCEWHQSACIKKSHLGTFAVESTQPGLGHELTRGRMGRAKRGRATTNTILEGRGQWKGRVDLEGGRVRS